MKLLYVFLGIILTFLSVKVFGAERATFEDPESLLRRGVEEIRKSREPANYAEYHLLLRLARDLARFDRPASTKLLAQSFQIAKSTEDQMARLLRLEMLALYASPIDKELSTQALLLIKNVEEDQSDPRVQLKLLAIDFILAHRQHVSAKDKILLDVKKFCREHETVREWDVGRGSSCAFAEYVTLLEPDLAEDVWTDMCPNESWLQRFEIAKDLIHYAPEAAAPMLRDLLETAPNKRTKVEVAVALYYANQKDEAFSIIERLKPEAVGGGWPLGDLLEQIARSDPNEAIRVALAMGSETGVRDAVDIVLHGVAATRPNEVPRLLKYMDNRYRRSTALRLAAESLAKKGELESAHKLADKIAVGEQRCTALATIGEVSKNAQLIKESLQLALKEDRYGRSLQAVTASAIRAFGVDETEKLLLHNIPNLQTKWEDARIFPLLLVVAELDPDWALRVLKCGPTREPRRSEDIAADSVSRLLPKLAPIDPAFVEKYLREHGKAEHPQTLQKLKIECVEQIAKRSVSKARDFSERLNTDRHRADERRLVFIYQTWQIVSAPKKVNQTLDQFKLRSLSEERGLVLRAAEIMVLGSLHNITGVIELGEALENKRMADEALATAARHLFQYGNKKEAFRLLDNIQSPWRRAEVLERMAYRELAPRPRERQPFLAGRG